jgi:hypothetical protein
MVKKYGVYMAERLRRVPLVSCRKVVHTLTDREGGVPDEPLPI